MADMNYVTRETGGFVASLQLFAFSLQDNIQLIIYSRTHSENYKERYSDNAPKGENRVLSVQPAHEPDSESCREVEGEKVHTLATLAMRLGG